MLPDVISHSTAGMWAYSAGIVGFDWMLARELKAHHHNKLARLVYAVDITIEVPAVVNNVLLPRSTR
jgi:hypothetical protein